jgi:hypothetical protein
MLGVAAATALPSEVWPFKKIFLPPAMPTWYGTSIQRPLLTMSAAVMNLERNRIDMLDISRWGVTDMEHLGELLAGAYPALMPPMPDYGDFFGLSRSVYPGRLKPTRFVYSGMQFVPFKKEQSAVEQLELELQKANREIKEALDDVEFS